MSGPVWRIHTIGSRTTGWCELGEDDWSETITAGGSRGYREMYAKLAEHLWTEHGKKI